LSAPATGYEVVKILLEGLEGSPEKYNYNCPTLLLLAASNTHQGLAKMILEPQEVKRDKGYKAP